MTMEQLTQSDYVEDGWYPCEVDRFYCEVQQCVTRPGRETNARWFLGWLADTREVHGTQAVRFACEEHVPRRDTATQAQLEYPFWLDVDNIPAHGLPIYSGFLQVDSNEPGRLQRIVQLRDLPAMLRLLARFNYGIEVSSAYHAYARAKLTLSNVMDYDMRRRARASLRSARAEMTRAEETWTAVKGIRAQYIRPEILPAIAQDMRTWPEVIATAYGDEYIELEDGSKFRPIAVGSMLVRFWPVFYDGERGPKGITTPMVFEVSAQGTVQWVGPRSLSAHPHAYVDAGAMCLGGEWHGSGLLAAVANLRNWWVGTDGSPISPWCNASQDWWATYRNTFFERYPEAKVLYAPTGRDEEARVGPLNPRLLDELLSETQSTQCYLCGRTVNQRYYCNNCEREVCEDHYAGEDFCTDCAPSYVCEQCERSVDYEDDLMTCTDCGERVCRRCRNEDYTEYCDRCGEEHHEYLKQEALAHPVEEYEAADYRLATPQDMYWQFGSCQFPSAYVWDQYGHEACSRPGVYILDPYGGYELGDPPNRLCEEHYRALLPDQRDEAQIVWEAMGGDYRSI